MPDSDHDVVPDNPRNFSYLWGLSGKQSQVAETTRVSRPSVGYGRGQGRKTVRLRGPPPEGPTGGQDQRGAAREEGC